MITPTFAIASINNDRSPVLVITERGDSTKASPLVSSPRRSREEAASVSLRRCSFALVALSSCENPPRMKNPSRASAPLRFPCFSLALHIHIHTLHVHTAAHKHVLVVFGLVDASARRTSLRSETNETRNTPRGASYTRRPRNSSLPHARACHRVRSVRKLGRLSGFTGHAQPDARHTNAWVSFLTFRWLSGQVLRSRWFF